MIIYHKELQTVSMVNEIYSIALCNLNEKFTRPSLIICTGHFG